MGEALGAAAPGGPPCGAAAAVQSLRNDIKYIIPYQRGSHPLKLKQSRSNALQERACAQWALPSPGPGPCPGPPVTALAPAQAGRLRSTRATQNQYIKIKQEIVLIHVKYVQNTEIAVKKSNISRAGPCSRECYEEVVALEQAEDRIAKLEEENGSLRELVEDMRAALQSSDARCLALQVGLRKSHANHKEEGTCFIGSKRLVTQNHPQTKCLQSVLKEVELIRSSRDGQIEEAIRFNQELERELKSSQEALVNLEDCNRNLKREQAEMRKKVEEARHAVLNSLGKVKELEVKANEVPHLQIYIQQLESELQHYRSETAKFQPPSRSSPQQKEGTASLDGRCCLSAGQQDRKSPTGGAGISENAEDQMFRSVEGQAASDEEEEKWTGDQQSQVAEVKKILAKLPCCGTGCDEKMRKKLMSYFGTTKTENYQTASVELAERITQLTEQLELKGHEVKKLETNMEEMKGPLLGELQQKVEETELLKMELQMLETERVRLSLVEEKFMDVLRLLQQLRDLNISKRALGKILLSTLESCRDPQNEGKAHLFEVLDTLYHELTACELLQSQPLEEAQNRRSLSNPLLISC
ncbi:EF-hand and coiled-coil domain-containing protein 1 [Apteryx rowi]|uniref:EF-hand and coiled-coil domain-containing protein 1 n=1 Tax=Apteryx rowi TaxID=308060 RepID=UPI000E1C4CAB|nr:EF-hand and coiled-coil domain-containing protein 1 [Apteryx rowi]